MRCPVLPVGDTVSILLQAVPPELVQAIRQALVQQGYPDPGPGAYGPAMAQVLYRWQRDHPDAASVDARIAEAVALARLPGVAGCATLSGLGIACEEVYLDPLIWGPVIGEQAATTAASLLAQAQRAGLVDLRCALAPAPPPSPRRPPSWLAWGAVFGALWYLKRRRRV